MSTMSTMTTTAQSIMPLTFTNDEKLACAEREVALRRRVYPNRVQTGRMSAAKALHEIECMKSIAADYRTQTQKERLL